ncbi:beta-2-microglobulin precursor [Cynoglossus semilaevis]|uniref:Beta-2-microglobulin n=1 Tax=Cynoglossus semilaevis TaxID=244447 RepID=C4PJS9_CYNSE|nr:beta-2-microglobulin precursor [Cynoglossus semilaevis]ACR38923.1 beta-2 microglobulin [Cynoglossus semilaevis]
MKGVVWLVFVVLPCTLKAEDSVTVAPMVQLYSKTIGLYNKPNTLICHAEDFYPPEISIELLKNNEVISEAKHSEMAFTDKWLYRVTRFTDFTPKSGDKYSCRVTHQGRERTYKWEPDV